MSERVSIHYHLSVAPGDEGQTAIYRVPGGRRLKNITTNITFPVASDYELHVAFYRGIRKQLPTSGDYVGDSTRISDDTPAMWGTDEDIILWYKNDNTTTAKDADILIEAELLT